MVSFVCFKWDGNRQYDAWHVNALAKALHKRYKEPHRVICVTDEPDGITCETMPLPASAQFTKDIQSPEGGRFPSSYRRLWCFSDEAKCLGERIMLLDIDAMIVGDIRPLLNVEADFIGWRPNMSWGKQNRVAGGTWLLRTGSCSSVWESFRKNPTAEIMKAKRDGWRGSDQAYISYKLQGCRIWPKDAGIYGKQDGVGKWRYPKKDARIVHFNGNQKPWESGMKWVRDYYGI